MRFFAKFLLLAAIPCAALAQGWKPTKDVEFVIPFAVGGGADLMARVIHKVIVDEKLVPVPVALVNKPGGGGAAGIGYVAASRKADPHTLILINGTTQITPILNPQAKTLTEVTPVMNMMLDDFLLFVRADAPWKSAADFVKEAKSKPAKSVAFSTGGTTDVMAITVLSKATGVEYNTVSFNSGGEALTALLGGHVQASMGNPLEFMGQLQAGKVRALGVVRDKRFPRCPTCRPSRSRDRHAQLPDVARHRHPEGRARRGARLLGRSDDQGQQLRGDEEVLRRTTSRRRRPSREAVQRVPRPPGEAVPGAPRQVDAS